MSQVTAVIPKIHIDRTHDPVAGPGIIPDPSPWSLRDSDGNPVMIWRCCGVNYRLGRQEGDAVLFVTRKSEASDPHYRILGYVEVDRIVDTVDMIEDPLFHDEFIDRHISDVKAEGHLPRDLRKGNSRSASQRIHNHFVGNPDNSAWFGLTEVGLKEVLDRAGIERDISKRVIPYLEGSEVNRVRETLFEDLELTAATGPVKTSAPPRSKAGPSMTDARVGDSCGGDNSLLRADSGCVNGGRSNTDSLAISDGGCGGESGPSDANNGGEKSGGC